MDRSWEAARRAARRVRGAELGREAISTVRPRTVGGPVRSRAPLSLLLLVAAREGRVVAQDDGGFAVLEPPLVEAWTPPAGPGLRVLRAIDHHWVYVAGFGPCVLSLVVAVALAPFALVASLVSVLLGMMWLAGCLSFQVVRDLGQLVSSKPGRFAESMPAVHWSAPLMHQPDPQRVDELLRLMTDRLRRLVNDQAQQRVGSRGRVSTEVTETLVVLTSGITTTPTRTTVADSLRAAPDFLDVGDVVVLAPPSRLNERPRHPVAGGGFLALYIGAIGLVIAVCARFAAYYEAVACRPSDCAGRPDTYGEAVRWLLQRLLLSDPPGLSPATFRSTVLGWLVSLLAVTALPVAYVAFGQMIRRNREHQADQDRRFDEMVDRSRVLVLVVADVERAAMLSAVSARTGRSAVLDQSGRRTVYQLGSLTGTEIYLAQAGEQGTAAAAGMLASALHVIPQVRPDYVVLVGICYGLRPDEGQKHGDVIVARRVQGVDHRKVTDDGVIQRGVNVGPSPVLLDRFQAGQTTWVSRAGARVHIGTVLTSNTLVDSSTMVEMLRDEFPDAIAGEMEGTGVYEATTEDDKPDWILVKAISDWGHGKDGTDQETAAANAADYVVHVIAGGGLNRRR